jgi:hypothetical protein
MVLISVHSLGCSVTGGSYGPGRRIVFQRSRCNGETDGRSGAGRGGELCFTAVQNALPPAPWIAELNSKAQSRVEQQFEAGRNYADKLSHAKDFRELARIQAEAWQSGLIVFQQQAKVLGRAYTKAVADAVNPLPKAG